MLIARYRPDPAAPVPLLTLGFRPFFLLAGMFSVVAVSIWGGFYVYRWSMPALPFTPVHWHAHEMIFGYGMAVLAGFLLTAVRNWTGIATLTGWPLATLALLWLAARLLAWALPGAVIPMLLIDVFFDLGLVVAVARPIALARQTEQLGILSKLVLLLVANVVFYLGAMGAVVRGIEWGSASGLYIIMALIFQMARRVLPAFIERGVGYPLQLKNHRWIDASSIYLLLLLWVCDVFWGNVRVTVTLAAILFAAHALRLAGWHTVGIWRRPLLWVLFVGYAGATLGFLLKAITPALRLPEDLAVHAFAIGGIGMITMGMMARVSLGHTGRELQAYSRKLAPMFGLIGLSFIARVLLPLALPGRYLAGVAIAQSAWIAAFSWFVWLYAPILTGPRADGRPA